MASSKVKWFTRVVLFLFTAIIFSIPIMLLVLGGYEIVYHEKYNSLSKGNCFPKFGEFVLMDDHAKVNNVTIKYNDNILFNEIISLVYPTPNIGTDLSIDEWIKILQLSTQINCRYNINKMEGYLHEGIEPSYVFLVFGSILFVSFIFIFTIAYYAHKYKVPCV